MADLITVEEIDESKEDGSLGGNQSKEHTDIVSDVMKKFHADRMSKEQLVEGWKDAVEEYENILQGSSDGLANIKNPILFSVIQNKLAEELSSMPDIRFLPTKSEDFQYVKPIRAAYFHSTANSRFNYNLFKCFLWKAIVGTGIGREEYVQEARTVFDLGKDGKQVPRVHYDFDDLMLTSVDPRRFFPDAKAEDMESARWTTEIEEIDFDEWRMKAEYDDSLIEENLDLVTPRNVYSYEFPEGVNFLTDEEQKKLIESATSENRVLLHKHIDKIKDKYIIIANGILVRNTPNPYSHKKLPYVRFVNYQELASFWGRSEYRILKQNIEEQNFLSNNMADWSKINVNRPLLVGATDFEDEDIEFAPGALWKVGDINQIRPLDLGDLPSGIFGLRDVLNADIVAYTGIDPRALVQSQEETATRSALKQEKFLKRIGLGLRLVDWTALEPFAKMRLSNIQQFYSQKQVEMFYNAEGEIAIKNKGYRNIRVQDVDVIKRKDGSLKFIDRHGATSFFEAKPDVIKAQMDVIAVTGSTLSTSKEVDRQNFTNGLQTLAAFPEMRQRMNWDGLTEEYAEKYGMNPQDVVMSLQTQELPSEEELSTEDMLAQEGVMPPGQAPQGAGGGLSLGGAPQVLPTEEEVSTEDLLAEGGINPPLL